MADRERAAQMESAVRDIQRTVGTHIFPRRPVVPPKSEYRDLNLLNPRTANQSRPRSASFEDMRLSMGASTLGRHLYYGDDSQGPTALPTRSSSTYSLRESTLDPQLTPGSVSPARQIPITSSNHVPSTASSLGWQSTFSTQSQVPKPLIFSPKEEAKEAFPAKDPPCGPISSNEPSKANNGVFVASNENLSKQKQKWKPVLTTYPSTDNIEQDAVIAHPAVRLPHRPSIPHVSPHEVVRPLNTLHQHINYNWKYETPDIQPAHNPQTYQHPQPPHSNTQVELQQEAREIYDENDGSIDQSIPWLQSLAGLLVFFNVWGLILSYGALQAFYGAVKLRGTSATSLAVIGSIQPFSLYLFAPVSAASVSGWKFRLCIHGGSILLILSIFCTSFCVSWWQLFLVQGIFTSAGMSMIFKATMESLALSCHHRFSVATAIAASGSTVGAVIYVCIIRSISSPNDFPWAIRYMGFVALGTLIPANIILRPLPRRQRIHSPMHSLTAWRRTMTAAQVPFWLASAGVLLASLGVLLPFYSIVAFGITNQHLSGAESCTHLLAMVASTLPGFTIPPLLEAPPRPDRRRRWSILDVLAPCAFVAALVVFLRIGTSTHQGLLALAVVYGFFAAALNGLDLPMVARLVVRHRGHDDADANNMTEAAEEIAALKDAAVCAAITIGFLVGPIVGAALVGLGGVGGGGSGYVYAQIFAGTTLAVGACCFTVARWMVSRNDD